VTLDGRGVEFLMTLSGSEESRARPGRGRYELVTRAIRPAVGGSVVVVDTDDRVSGDR